MKNNFLREISTTFLVSMAGLFPTFKDVVAEKKAIFKNTIKRGDGLIKTMEHQKAWEEEQYLKLTNRYSALYEAGYYLNHTEPVQGSHAHHLFGYFCMARKLKKGPDFKNSVVHHNGILVPIQQYVDGYESTQRLETYEDAQLFLDLIAEGTAIREILNERTKNLIAERESLPGPQLIDIEYSLDKPKHDPTDPIAILLTFPVSAQILIDELQQHVNSGKLIANLDDITKLVRYTFNFSDDPMDKAEGRPSKKLKWAGTQASLVKVFAHFYPASPPVVVRDAIADMLEANFVLVGVPGNPNINRDTLRKALRDFGYGGKVKTVKQVQRSKKE